jgi:hypothetical protein
MFAEMVCGKCESYFNADSDDDDAALWVMMNRFANAHVPCGYMTPMHTEESMEEGHKKVIKPRLSPDQHPSSEGS